MALDGILGMVGTFGVRGTLAVASDVIDGALLAGWA